jgi:tetratricopeptide (TPR) repeat protein
VHSFFISFLSSVLVFSLFLVEATNASTKSVPYQDSLGKKDKLLAHAIAYLEDAARKKAGVDVIHFSLGVLYWLRNNTEKAKEEMALAWLKDSKDSRVPFVLAMVYYDEGDVANCRKYLEESIQNAPPLLDAFSSLGTILSKTGEIEESIRLLEKAKLIFPEESALYYNQAINFGLLKQYTSALESLNKVLTLNPQDLEALSLTGYILSIQKKPVAARRVFEKILLGNPKHLDSLLGMAASYFVTKDFEQAIFWAEKAQALYPENPDITRDLQVYREAQEHWENKYKRKMSFKKKSFLTP